MANTAPRTSPEININLMPTRGPSGTAGTAVAWVLTVGRYLIILTEVVALVIFVLGIKLSSDKNDLKDEIQVLGDSISHQSDFEQEFRGVQLQISEIKNQRSSRSLNNVVVTEFLKLLPQGMTLKSFEIKVNEITFSGSFTTPSELQTMVYVFSESEKITGLDITDLNSPTEKNPLYTFTAQANINRAKFKEGVVSK